MGKSTAGFCASQRHAKSRRGEDSGNSFFLGVNRVMNEHTRAELTHVKCCIIGGGPAGMMLGFLLARAGVDVLVLEKHDDFLPDFRGDTVHPSTLEVMQELGLLDELLQRPH